MYVLRLQSYQNVYLVVSWSSQTGRWRSLATSIGQHAQELSRTNPWWRGGRWQDIDPDLQAAASQNLNYVPDVLHGIRPGGLYLLRGPRRVGKTVTIKRKILELLEDGIPANAIVRVAADGWPAKAVRTVVQNVALPPIPDGHVRWWFFDEISAAEAGWDSQVKWLRDNDASFARACVVLTGSDASDLAHAVGTLAGRRGNITDPDRTLLPMGFHSFAKLAEPSLPNISLNLADLHTPAATDAYRSLLPWLDDLVVAWERYLAYGGFPIAVGAYRRAERVPESFLDTMIDVIGRDAFSASQLPRRTSSELVERLWTSIGTPVNLSSIAEDIGVAHPTVSRHVEYLADAYLLWSCPQRHPDRWIPRKGSQAKLYPVDPLIARLAHLRNSNRHDIDPTVLTETMIGVAIHRSLIAAGRMWDDDQHLFYLRTPARKEIDFVSEDLAGTAIEGKYTERSRWRSEAATVNASSFKGILATRNVLDDSGEDAWAVPAGFLTYLIDG